MTDPSTQKFFTFDLESGEATPEKRKEHEEILKKEEEVWKRQRKIKALLRGKQRMTEDTIHLEEPALKKLKEDEAMGSEEAAASISMQNVKMDLSPSRRTWTEMRYSPNLKSGAIVHVVFCWTPIDFQVVCDNDWELLELLQADLLDRVSAGKLKRINSKPQRDDVVIAERNGAFYRARVSNSNSLMCQLCFFDYGDIAIKKNEEIYEIPEDMYRAPVYGLKIRLDGLEATDLSLEALFSDIVEPELYETAYTLQLTKRVGDGHIRGILRDASNNNDDQTLNAAVKNSLLMF